MASSRIIAIAFLLFFAPLVCSEEPAPSHSRTVDRFIAAFNAHDSNAMAALVTDDVEWLSISADKIAVETKGKSKLVASMDAYFKSCPTCRSTISETITTPARVSAIEVASWKGKDGEKSQKGLSVYEFSGDLIRRVYYFPVEK